MLFDIELDDTHDIPDFPVPKYALEPVNEEPYKNITMEHLMNCLPPLISCSPLSIRLCNGKKIDISRRDLFDARFQLIKEQDTDDTRGKEAIDFMDSPSDLVHGVYEGGLKTWECSLDLVDHFSDHDPTGKRIFEVGCGTAIPSLYLLHKVFSSPTPPKQETVVHLQDYNTSVLELITFPNIVLSWYMSPASKTYRESAEVVNDPYAELPPADPSVAVDVPLSSNLKSAFIASLKEYNITLHFSSGSWRSCISGGAYDVVFTSETIYRSESVPNLIALLRSSSTTSTLTLVAAKVFYFGVGGGITAFVEEAEKIGARVETVWEKRMGVGRKILKITW